MYNQIVKEAFINSRLKTSDEIMTAKLLFNFTAVFEEEAGEDFANLPKNVWYNALSEEVKLGSDVWYNMIHIITMYTKWHKRKGRDAIVQRMADKGDEQLRNVSMYLSGPLHLQKCLNGIFGPEINNAIASETSVYRVFAWLIYAGIPETDIKRITCKDIDIGSLCVTYNGWRYPIYREGILSFADILNKHGESGSQNSEIAVENGKTVNYHSFVKKSMSFIQNVQKNGKPSEFPMLLNEDKIRRSGLMYRIYEYDFLYSSPDFREIAMEDISQRSGLSAVKKPDEIDDIDERDSYVKQVSIMANKFQRLYIVWKSAYHSVNDIGALNSISGK